MEPDSPEKQTAIEPDVIKKRKLNEEGSELKIEPAKPAKMDPIEPRPEGSRVEFSQLSPQKFQPR